MKRLAFIAALVAQALCGATATFIKADTATQGTWKGVYGSEGQLIAGLTPAPPAYATVGFTGKFDSISASTTMDVFALQRPGTATDRISSVWASSAPATWSMEVTFTDATPHQVALYLRAAATNARSEQVEVRDLATGGVLDTRQINDAGMDSGTWLVWKVSGSIKVVVSLVSGWPYPVASGLFFDSPPTFTLSVTPPNLEIPVNASAAMTVTLLPAAGVNSTVALSATGLPFGVTGVFAPATITNSAPNSTLTLTADRLAAADSYQFTIVGTPTTGLALPLNASFTVKAGSRTILDADQLPAQPQCPVCPPQIDPHDITPITMFNDASGNNIYFNSAKGMIGPFSRNPNPVDDGTFFQNKRVPPPARKTESCIAGNWAMELKADGSFYSYRCFPHPVDAGVFQWRRFKADEAW